MMDETELPDKRYSIRVRYFVAGGHTHMRIYTGVSGSQLGKAGELVMTNEEFEAWRLGSAEVLFVREEWASR